MRSTLSGKYDIVADGSDNFPTRFLVSDACYLAKKTLVAAAVGQFDGQLSTFKPHLKDAQGVPYPTYRCLHPEAPPPKVSCPLVRKPASCRGTHRHHRFDPGDGGDEGDC